MRTAKKIALSTLGLVVATTLACQTTSGGGGGDLDLESGVPLNVTADAYRAYERGDCDEVAQRPRAYRC